MASIFKDEPMTYRVDSSWLSGRGTRQRKLERAGYLSATPVYGPVYQKKWQRSSKTTPTRDIIGYDAQIMTRVEYRQPEAPATTIEKQEAPKSIGGPGANKGSSRRNAGSSMGVAGQAFAGNIGSVNTEEQNDDELMPYMKENV